MIKIIDETCIRIQLDACKELEHRRECATELRPLSTQTMEVTTLKGKYRIYLRGNRGAHVCRKESIVLRKMRCCKCSGYIFFTEHNNIGINSYQLHLKCACSKGYLIVDLAKVIPTVVKSTWGVDVQSLGRLYRVTS